jgi:hypothetical protein
MQIESLGHESWLLTSNSTRVLIDPLLFEFFGMSQDYPYRKLSHSSIPKAIISKISAVILTTEHFQHCDITSLNNLPKNTTLYVSENFSYIELGLLKNIGFNVNVLKVGTPFIHEDIEFIFTPSDDSTKAFDSRVCSLLLADLASPEKNWVFIQSDTGISSQIMNFIPKKWRLKPSAVIVTSHFKQYSDQGFSHWDNLISTEDDILDPRVALNVIQEILPTTVYPLNVSERYIIAGGDYERVGFEMPENPSFDNLKIQQIGSKLAINCSIDVATAGFCVDLSKQKVTPPESQIKPRDGSHTKKIRGPFSVQEIKPSNLSSDEEMALEKGLSLLGKSFLLSELGHDLLFTNNYLGQNLDAKRFVLKLVSRDSDEVYAFCFEQCAFVKCHVDDDKLLEFPAGLVLSKSSFIDTILERASPAEACSFNSVHWHIGSNKNEPLGLFYSTFQALRGLTGVTRKSEYSQTQPRHVNQ